MEFKVNDIVKISGAYFKSSNGTFRVTNIYERGGKESLTLHRINRDGSDSKSRNSVEFWPLTHYCSDSRKNHEAAEHDRENAKIEITGVWSPVEKPAEFPDDGKIHQVRFYYNGMKVNGGDLIRCFYSLDNDVNHDTCVSIHAREYDDLPADLFVVENGTDLYTDYFEKDHTVVTPEHPLYKYIRYAAEQNAIRDLNSGIKYNEERLEHALPYNRDFIVKELAEQRQRLEVLKKHKNPGHPTEEDIAKVYEMKNAAESARLAEEEAERQREREETIKERQRGELFISDAENEYPIKAGEPIVTISFSEYPAFYNLVPLKLSVKAADTILRHFDVLKAAKKEGYDKTDFLIEYTNEAGEPDKYEGRYDLGDNDGGLAAHIRSYAGWSEKVAGALSKEQSENDAAEIRKFADFIETFTEDGKIINISIAPWLLKAAEKKKELEEQQRTSFDDVLEEVAMLTDEQLEAAVFDVDPHDKENIDVARFFLQELLRRDEAKARDVLRRWRGN